MAQDLVATFQSLLEKQLKQQQDSTTGSSSGLNIQNSNNPSEVPSVLELSFKLTTPEKTVKVMQNKTPESGPVREYDKPKRSWKERAHHEQEGLGETATVDHAIKSGESILKTGWIKAHQVPGEQDVLTDSSKTLSSIDENTDTKMKNTNEETQGKSFKVFY